MRRNKWPRNMHDVSERSIGHAVLSICCLAPLGFLVLFLPSSIIIDAAAFQGNTFLRRRRGLLWRRRKGGRMLYGSSPKTTTTTAKSAPTKSKFKSPRTGPGTRPAENHPPPALPHKNVHPVLGGIRQVEEASRVG